MLRLFYDTLPRSIVLNKDLFRSAVEVKDDEYVITIEAAGLKKEDIKITLEDSVLTVEAKRVKEENVDYALNEFFYGDLHRSFDLKDLKDAQIKAAYVDGIITVRVPKLTEAETKKIITIE